VSRLSKSKAEVWDRLKNGIPPVDDMNESLEFILSEYMAKHMAEQIDKEMLQTLMNIVADK